jgi:hypothetical protein
MLCDLHKPAFGNTGTWHLNLPLELPGTWRKWRQPITFDEVQACASQSDTMFHIVGGTVV